MWHTLKEKKWIVLKKKKSNDKSKMLPTFLLSLAFKHSVNCHNVPTTRFLLRIQVPHQGERHPPQSISIRGHLRHLWVLVVPGEAGNCPRKRKRGCFPKGRDFWKNLVQWNNFVFFWTTCKASDLCIFIFFKKQNSKTRAFMTILNIFLSWSWPFLIAFQHQQKPSGWFGVFF